MRNKLKRVGEHRLKGTETGTLLPITKGCLGALESAKGDEEEGGSEARGDEEAEAKRPSKRRPEK